MGIEGKKQRGLSNKLSISSLVEKGTSIFAFFPLIEVATYIK